MKKLIPLIAALLMSGSLFASNSFNCEISNIQTSNSIINSVIVTMACSDNTSPIPSGTNGCTAPTVSNNSFIFDTSTNHGKVNLSILMMAYSSRKRVLASTYATCPAGAPSTPVLYGLKTFDRD